MWPWKKENHKLTPKEERPLCHYCGWQNGNRADLIVKEGGLRFPVCDECYDECCTFDPIEEIFYP